MTKPAPTAPAISSEPKSEVAESLAALAALQSEVQPVGHDYVEEVPETLSPHTQTPESRPSHTHT